MMAFDQTLSASPASKMAPGGTPWYSLYAAALAGRSVPLDHRLIVLQIT